MGGVLQYKWEVYCWVCLSSRHRSQEGTVIQMGGVLPTSRGWGFLKFSETCGCWLECWQAVLKGPNLAPAPRQHFSGSPTLGSCTRSPGTHFNGRKTTPKTTHPNQKSLRKQFSEPVGTPVTRIRHEKGPHYPQGDSPRATAKKLS